MTKLIAPLMLAFFLTTPVLADKPEWAGAKGQPTQAQKDAHRSAMEAKGDSEDTYGRQKEKLKKEKKQYKERYREEREKSERHEKPERERHHEDDDSRDRGKAGQSSGLEKQGTRKAEQTQKELGRGSEQGQEAREQRRKWWKFWGEGE